jgi:RNA polymerase sigma-70 factor (ECF subfamily)
MRASSAGPPGSPGARPAWRYAGVPREFQLSSSPATTTVLLESLKDPAQAAVWREFDARFRPLLTAFGVRLGLDPDEAEDVAQEALVEFVGAYREGKYDRSRGRLSSWIISIARNLISDRRRGAGRLAGRRGDSAMVDLSDPAALGAVWDSEQHRLIIVRAMELLRRGRTGEPALRAFELVALRGVPAEEAALECGMSVDDVYAAKSRVTRRLRAIVQELTGAWREGE